MKAKNTIIEQSYQIPDCLFYDENYIKNKGLIGIRLNKTSAAVKAPKKGTYDRELFDMRLESDEDFRKESKKRMIHFLVGDKEYPIHQDQEMVWNRFCEEN